MLLFKNVEKYYIARQATYSVEHALCMLDN